MLNHVYILKESFLKNHYKEGDPHENISQGDASEKIEELKTTKNSNHVEKGGKEKNPRFVFKEFKRCKLP